MYLPPNFRVHDYARLRAHQVLWLAIAGVAGTAFAATTSTTFSGDVGDTIRIAASPGTERAMQHWAAIFHRDHPTTRVVLMTVGTGSGLTALIDGQASLASQTRPLRPIEISMAKRAGTGPRALLAGVDRLARVPVYLVFKRQPNGLVDAKEATFLNIALRAKGRAQVLSGNRPQAFARAVGTRRPTNFQRGITDNEGN